MSELSNRTIESLEGLWLQRKCGLHRTKSDLRLNPKLVPYQSSQLQVNRTHRWPYEAVAVFVEHIIETMYNKQKYS